MRNTWNANPSVFPAPEIRNVLNSFGSGTVDASGFVGGGQVGCQRQINAAVFGVEADIQYTGLSGSRPVSFPGNSGVLPLNFREDFRSTWLATFRGRAGWLVNPAVLLYATGGVAVANLKTFDFVVDALQIPQASILRPVRADGSAGLPVSGLNGCLHHSGPLRPSISMSILAALIPSLQAISKGQSHQHQSVTLIV